ncbi:hypothetical protein FPSE5266_05214 [Fusarium pseudograminearum]|nr:hypothetical protein FPSE5266_05214 [Fusarium pseudograminearum]
MGSPKINYRLWREALDAKFHSRGKPWGREEFDKIFGSYDAVLDIPAICFVEELVAAYPEAKVIVMQHDVDSWLRNMNSTSGRVLRWPLWDTLASWDSTHAGPFWEFSKIAIPASFHTVSDFSTKSPARQAFHDHYELVRRTVPVERTLEYRVEEGWGPLSTVSAKPAGTKECSGIYQRCLETITPDECPKGDRDCLCQAWDDMVTYVQPLSSKTIKCLT